MSMNLKIEFILMGVFEMSLSIFMAYIDYCKKKNKEPNIIELYIWKKKYNDR